MLSLEAGTFFADSSGPTRVMQLVARGATSGQTEVTWSIERMADDGDAADDVEGDSAAEPVTALKGADDRLDTSTAKAGEPAAKDRDGNAEKAEPAADAPTPDKAEDTPKQDEGSDKADVESEGKSRVDEDAPETKSGATSGKNDDSGKTAPEPDSSDERKPDSKEPTKPAEADAKDSPADNDSKNEKDDT